VESYPPAVFGHMKPPGVSKYFSFFSFTLKEALLFLLVFFYWNAVPKMFFFSSRTVQEMLYVMVLTVMSVFLLS
jgi:hypothetical protein